MLTVQLTFVDLWRPSRKIAAVAYDAALIIAGSIVVALSAKIVIPLPFSPVPVTGQTLAVLLVGALYGSKRGSLAILAYLAEGISGLPVFAQGGGILYLFGPTGGYLAGFVFGAYITGWLSERGWDRKVPYTLLAMSIGNIAIFFFGVTWLYQFIGSKALVVGIIPFIPGGIIKTIIAAAILPSGWKLINRFRGW
jgi:biotin transport system substrate-specific component